MSERVAFLGERLGGGYGADAPAATALSTAFTPCRRPAHLFKSIHTVHGRPMGRRGLCLALVLSAARHVSGRRRCRSDIYLRRRRHGLMGNDCCESKEYQMWTCTVPGYSPQQGGSSSYPGCGPSTTFQCCKTDPAAPQTPPPAPPGAPPSPSHRRQVAPPAPPWPPCPPQPPPGRATPALPPVGIKRGVGPSNYYSIPRSTFARFRLVRPRAAASRPALRAP